MRKLERNRNAPAWLQQYRHETDKWKPTDAEKDEIWSCLIAMQNNRCAYCEADITDMWQREIEHFAARSKCRELTFLWANLFGACKNKASCGTYKDRKEAAPYDWSDLIKPDIHDPDMYLVFVSNGSIIPRHDLNPDDLRRAEETLRVFNLDAIDGTLRKLREAAIAGPLRSFEATYDMWLNDPDLIDLDEEFQTLIDDNKELPFCTAIRHALTTAGTR